MVEAVGEADEMRIGFFISRRADAPAELDAVDAAEIPVGKDDVRTVGAVHRLGFRLIARGAGPMAEASYFSRKILTSVVIRLRDEDAERFHGSRFGQTRSRRWGCEDGGGERGRRHDLKDGCLRCCNNLCLQELLHKAAASTCSQRQQFLHVVHVPSAHTDGDAIIKFRKANVIHMGDTFFNGFYPFIDIDSGGSVDGAIAAADRGLSLSDAGTKIIPGHGPLGTKADLQAYRDMLAGIRDRVKALVAQGKRLEQVLAAKPSAQWDAKWGNGFLNPDAFVSSVHRSLTESKK